MTNCSPFGISLKIRSTILFHFVRLYANVSEEECYHCLANLVAAKEKVFITQTKMLFEATWKTVMQIAKKHAVSIVYFNCSAQLLRCVYHANGWHHLITVFFFFCFCSIEISRSSLAEAIPGTKDRTCFYELDMVGAGRASISTFSTCDGLLFPRRHQSFLSDFVGHIDFIPEARSKYIIGSGGGFDK